MDSYLGMPCLCFDFLSPIDKKMVPYDATSIYHPEPEGKGVFEHSIQGIIDSLFNILTLVGRSSIT